VSSAASVNKRQKPRKNLSLKFTPEEKARLSARAGCITMRQAISAAAVEGMAEARKRKALAKQAVEDPQPGDPLQPWEVEALRLQNEVVAPRPLTDIEQAMGRGES
jgi:hypothetical protein